MCISKVRVNGTFVPCRKCPECVVRRQNEWIFRIKQEIKEHKYNGFYTLTYNEMNIPILDKNDGGIVKSLCYDDIQKFFKRLRKQCKSLKYYAVGEYGDRTKRPHYHAIIMGEPKEEYIKKVDINGKLIMDNNTFYRLVNKAWQKGHIHHGDASHRAIRYCIKYMTKRVKDTPEDAELPKACMSKGIGKSYIEKHGNIHYERSQEFVYEQGGYKIPLPTYYAQKIWDNSCKKGKLRYKWIQDIKANRNEIDGMSDYQKFVQAEVQAKRYEQNKAQEYTLEKHSKSTKV